LNIFWSFTLRSYNLIWDINFKMAVPKKKKSKSKRNQRHSVWKAKASEAANRALSLGKSVLTGKAQGFVYPIDEEESEE